VIAIWVTVPAWLSLPAFVTLPAAWVTGPGSLALPWFGDVSLSPNLNGLPGGAELQSLTNGLGGWALLLSLVGLVIGAVMWALGSHSQNYHQSFSGRRAVLVSALAALLIGAGPALVNFFFHAGTNVH
jgi:Family of unknown function (DUF6112)